MLPGMMCNRRLFSAQAKTLGSRYDVVVPSLTAGCSIEEMAKDVLCEITAAKFNLAGLSMGGIVAIDIIRQAPDRVSRLALIDTSPLAEAADVKARREPQIAAARAGNLAAVLRDELKPNYLANGDRKREILDLCTDMALTLGPDVFERHSRALQNRADRQETLRKVQAPTLIMMGEDDRLCPRDVHDLMHNLVSGSRLSIIEGAGHLPTLEKPDETTAELVRWLEE